MAKKSAATLSGPGRLGSDAAMRKSLKGGGDKFVKTIPGEGSLTVRFLDEPEDFVGYYEHWIGGKPQPCVTDECEGCESDDEKERRRNFRYLANCYVVDDQKVRAVKLPKTLVQQLMDYYDKAKGTLRDRDYDLTKRGSGQENTRYMASPDAPQKMKLERFDKKKLDLSAILQSMIDGEDPEGVEENDEPKKSKKKAKKDKPKKTKEKHPWDDEPEPSKKKKSASKSKPAEKRSVKKSTGTSKRRVIRK